MKEPRRLFDDATGIERAVLDAANDHNPSPERQRRLVAAGAATATALSASAATAKAALVLKLAVVLAGVGALSIGYEQVAHDPVVVTNEASEAPFVRPALPLPPVAPAIAAAAPPESSVGVAVSVAAVPHRPPVPVPTVSAPRVPIAREIALLDEARAAIKAGDAARARAALDRYDTECAGGALAIEAARLRTFASSAPPHEITPGK